MGSVQSNHSYDDLVNKWINYNYVPYEIKRAKIKDLMIIYDLVIDIFIINQTNYRTNVGDLVKNANNISLSNAHYASWYVDSLIYFKMKYVNIIKFCYIYVKKYLNISTIVLIIFVNHGKKK